MLNRAPYFRKKIFFLILRSIQKPWAKTIYLYAEKKFDIVLQKVEE